MPFSMSVSSWLSPSVLSPEPLRISSSGIMFCSSRFACEQRIEGVTAACGTVRPVRSLALLEVFRH
jgi:hypothetical protein